MSLPLKKTKIVCTIGPASESQAILEHLIQEGMNIARLNFAHGDFENHRKVIENIRSAAEVTGQRVSIMADLPGPKIRIGLFDQDTVELKRGQEFTLQTKETKGNADHVSVSFADLPQAVKPEDIIFVNDGYVQLEVQTVHKDEIQCKVLVGGQLRSHKGLNLPGIDLGVCAFTAHDRECLAFALEQGVDAISQSFVQNREDIKAVRDAAASFGYTPFIIAKIERSRALKNIDAILEAADGIMVARGDLGVEIPIEEIAITQKQLIRKANLVGKPVITATQMLESMVENRRPTRAEVADISNAILDGTDCIMLSEESAIGNYPQEAVAIMARIAEKTEAYIASMPIHTSIGTSEIDRDLDLEDLIALSIYSVVKRLRPTAVVTPTKTGATARNISRFKLPMWIIAPSRFESTCQNLQFSSGVYSVHVEKHPDSWEVFAREWLGKHGLAKNIVLLTQGFSSPYQGGTNRMDIIDFNSSP